MADQWIHVYDLQEDTRHSPSTKKEWLAAIADGVFPMRTKEGLISKVYWESMGDWPMFEITDEQGRSQWTRMTSPTKDNSFTEQQKADLYQMGKRVRVTYVKEKLKKPDRGFHKHVLDIWIGHGQTNSS